MFSLFLSDDHLIQNIQKKLMSLLWSKTYSWLHLTRTNYMNYMFGNFTYKRFFCVLTYACSTSSSFSSGVLQDLILGLGLSLQYHLSGSLSRSVPWGSLRHFRQSSHWTQLWSGSCLKNKKNILKKTFSFLSSYVLTRSGS